MFIIVRCHVLITFLLIKIVFKGAIINRIGGMKIHPTSPIFFMNEKSPILPMDDKRPNE